MWAARPFRAIFTQRWPIFLYFWKPQSPNPPKSIKLVDSSQGQKVLPLSRDRDSFVQGWEKAADWLNPPVVIWLQRLPAPNYIGGAASGQFWSLKTTQYFAPGK